MLQAKHKLTQMNKELIDQENRIKNGNLLRKWEHFRERRE